MRSFLAATALAAALLLPCAGAGAAEPGLKISIEPLVVQFAVAPGGQARTTVTIKNVGSEPAVVVAKAIDWHTTLDGTVKTERVGTESAASLGWFLRLSANDFTLAPGEKREMTLALALPTSFSSKAQDYWGGYLVRAVPAGAPTATSFGVGANILAYETVGTAPRHVKLTALRVTDAGAGNVRITGRILNDGGTYVRPSIRMQLAQSGRIVQSFDDSTPAIFAGEPRSYSRIVSGLARGAYLLQVTIDYGGPTLVQGTTDFTVR